MRTALGLGLVSALACAACVTAACTFLLPLDQHDYTGGNGIVTVVLDDSACLEAGANCQSAAAAFVEVGSYAGQCPTGDAAPGAPCDLEDLLVHRADGQDAVGDPGEDGPRLAGLTSGPRAFFGLLRDPQCGVTSWGCIDVDYSGQAQVTVPLHPAPTSLPRSGTCYGGSCACPGPSSFAGGDGGSPPEAAVDAACALQLVAAGALPPPGCSGDFVSGPSLATTNDGFVIALREQTVSGTTSASQLRTVFLTADGAAQRPNVLSLGYYDRQCGSQAIPDDGVGIAFDRNKGIGAVVVSQPACGARAGATFVPLSSKGDLSSENDGTNFTDFTLARSHALAVSSSPQGDFELAFVSQAQPYDAFITAYAPSGYRPGLPPPPATFAAVASSATLRVFLVGRGGDAGASVEAYTGSPSANGSLATTLPGTTQASAAVGASGAIAAALTGAGIAWATFDGGGGAWPSSPTATLTGGPYLSLDVTALDGEPVGPYVLAAGLPGDLAIARADVAGGTLTAIPSLAAVSQAALKDLLASFDGEHVAVASGYGSIAVAWLTRHALRAGDPAGGWALLSCR